MGVEAGVVSPAVLVARLVALVKRAGETEAVAMVEVATEAVVMVKEAAKAEAASAAEAMVGVATVEVVWVEGMEA